MLREACRFPTLLQRLLSADLLAMLLSTLASSACSERIKFRLAVIVYRALHGTAPQYLSGQLQFVADLPSRRRGRLRSSTSSLLHVRPSRLVTVGDRSFAAAGPRLWSSLPVDVQPAPSLISSETEYTFIPAIIPIHCFSCFAIVVLDVTFTWATLNSFERNIMQCNVMQCNAYKFPQIP